MRQTLRFRKIDIVCFLLVYGMTYIIRLRSRLLRPAGKSL